MATLDERLTDLEHRLLVLEQVVDKLMMEKNNMYYSGIDSTGMTWNIMKEEDK